jgi:hypothetical protein
MNDQTTPTVTLELGTNQLRDLALAVMHELDSLVEFGKRYASNDDHELDAWLHAKIQRHKALYDLLTEKI